MRILLSYSYKYVPYYQRIFNRLGITPNDIKTEKDFENFPVLTKNDLQSNLNDLVSNNFNIQKLIKNSSGGSTGEPTIFFQDSLRNELRKAYVMRHNKWAGWDIGKKTALIWGIDDESNLHKRFKSKIKNYFIGKKIWLNAFDLSEQKIIKFSNKLQKYKPDIVIGYSSALYNVFKILKEKRISIPPPKGIVSSAEALYSWQRELIEEVSGANVFNRYGSREIGLICSQCSNKSEMHINAENVYVECIKNNKSVANGEVGNVVATDLLNYGMPLIRYDTEDNATFSDKICDCGRGLPLIKTIHGRTSDMIKTEDGRLIHGEYFTHLFYGINGINKFQLIQKKNNSIELMIEVKSNFNPEIIKTLKFKITKATKSKNVSVNIVDEIPLLNSGKHRFTISEI